MSDNARWHDKTTLYKGEAEPDPADALKPSVCKCSSPLPQTDEDGTRTCFWCSKRLPKGTG